MKTYLGHVMPIALAVLAACSENKLEVGNGNDADIPDSAGGGGAPACKEGEIRVDGCRECICDVKTGQFQCPTLLCTPDGGPTNPDTNDTTQCEYQGKMLAPGETVPAKDNCNTCTCNASSRQMICTRNACTMDGGSANSTEAGSGGAGGSGTGGSGGSSGGATACPFVASPKPITLGTLLGAGRSPSTGTIYVVDEAESLQRVFISDSNGALVRQRVSGSGSGTEFMVFTTNGPDAIVTVQIDTPAGQPKRMGVVQGLLTDRRKTMVIGQDGEELTMLAASEFAKAMLLNLPGTVTTEYVASTVDGNFIVVTRPTDDARYEDFRLFYGPATAISERKVSKVMRALDGGSTSIEFDLNGVTARAYFQVVFADAGFAPGPATLTIASESTLLTRLSAPPADAKYICSTH